MSLMSTSMVICQNLMLSKTSSSDKSVCWHDSIGVVQLRWGRKRFVRLVPNAKKNNSKKKTWWQKFFFEDDGNWLGLKDDDMIDGMETEDSSDDEMSEDEKFEAWKRRAETIIELREAQEDLKNEENRSWEDWLVDGTADVSNGSSWAQDSNDNVGRSRDEVQDDLNEIIPVGRFVESVRSMVLGREDDDFLYEDRVFRYASFNSYGLDREKVGYLPIVTNIISLLKSQPMLESTTRFVSPQYYFFYTGAWVENLKSRSCDTFYTNQLAWWRYLFMAKFLAVLLLIPLALDFLVHDYVLMPFLDSYVKKVPLAAQMLDVRRSQKLEMVKEIKLEKARYRLEVEIGKSPPLSEEELWLELRHRALELQNEWRLRNRAAFANIWSDIVFGTSLFALLYFNQKQVALLKFTGYKIINNISDTGKAFLIILITDIFLGYHSESGWQTLSEILVEHYGFEVDKGAITIFVCIVPVIMDACVKLWMFKYLPKLSPKVATIFQEMTRH